MSQDMDDEQKMMLLMGFGGFETTKVGLQTCAALVFDLTTSY